MYIKIFQKTNLQFMPENEKQETDIYKSGYESETKRK